MGKWGDRGTSPFVSNSIAKVTAEVCGEKQMYEEMKGSFMKLFLNHQNLNKKILALFTLL